MIKSAFSSNKVTANQRAKQELLSAMDVAGYSIGDDDRLTDDEREEIHRFLNKHIDAIYSRMNGDKLYDL